MFGLQHIQKQHEAQQSSRSKNDGSTQLQSFGAAPQILPGVGRSVVATSSQAPLFSSGELFGPPTIRPEELIYLEKIGGGCYGSVYRGKCRGKEVAIKKLFRQDLSEKALNDFQKEIEICARLHHPNVVLFMGACSVPGHMAIVTELLNATNVEKMLHDPNRMLFGKDTAMGMNWLHCSKPPILHRDLKPSNLLVTKDNRVKVCDFGLSMVKPEGEMIKDVAAVPGTPLWMAPEVMSGGSLDEKSDVYSFAFVLWEMATQKPLLPEIKNFTQLKKAICVEDRRPPTDDLMPALRDLLLKCWQKDAKGRPSFDQILKELDYIIIYSAISDPGAATMWKKCFLGHELVPWEDFMVAYCKYLGLPVMGLEDLDCRCLHALLAKKCADKTLKERPWEVSIEQFGRVLQWFGPMERPDGVCPMTIEIENCLRQEWFHGEIEKEKAEKLLTGTSIGTFLVRCSTTIPGQPFTISRVNSQGGVTHQRIMHLPGGSYGMKIIKNNKKDDFTLSPKMGEGIVAFIEAAKPVLNLKFPAPGSKYKTVFERRIKGQYDGYDEHTGDYDDIDTL